MRAIGHPKSTPGSRQRKPRPAVTPPNLVAAAGNRAVGRALATRPSLLGSALCRGGNRALARDMQPRRSIARYDTGEHALFGGDTVVFARGDVQITESEMITMGDLYEFPEDMEQADIAELQRIVELVRRDKNAYLGLKGAKHVSDAEWESATPKGPHRKKTYLELAEENATHFAPRRSHDWKWETARDHRAEWQRLHKRALDAARTAKTPADLQRAHGINAFAAHFLTDAFSAGHLINKEQTREAARKSWDRLPTQYWIFHENEFTRKVADAVLADPYAGRQLRKYWIRIVKFQPMSAEPLSELLWQFATRDDYRDKFYDNFVKSVHDELNVTGVEVSNPRGDTWTVRGDSHLLPDDPSSKRESDASRETLRIGRAAVAQSVKNVEEAAKTKGSLDYQKLFDKVWDYAPRPTGAGQSHIDDVSNRLLDLTRPEAVKAFAQIIISHVDMLIYMLNDPSVDRLESPDEIRGMPGKPM
jgi:hypothetical protein